MILTTSAKNRKMHKFWFDMKYYLIWKKLNLWNFETKSKNDTDINTNICDVESKRVWEKIFLEVVNEHKLLETGYRIFKREKTKVISKIKQRTCKILMVYIYRNTLI